MELKTKVSAEPGTQDVFITRDFDLPLELLFRAHVEADIVSEWMGTEVLKMESRPHGSFQLRKADANGNVVFAAIGVIHNLIPNKKIIRTFEMENWPIGVQLEIYEFESVTDETSRLKMHVIYESTALRDGVLKYGMAPGLSMAHDRLEAAAKKLK